MENKAKIAGILSIVSGAFGIVGFFVLVMIALFLGVSGGILSTDQTLNEALGGVQVIGILQTIYLVYGIICLILGVLGIIGGVFSIRRKAWGLALAGAIAGVFTFLPAGVAAIIFVVMGKGEFSRSQPQIPVAQP